MQRVVIVVMTVLVGPWFALVEEAPGDVHAGLREQMVQQGVIGWGIRDDAVIEAMRRTPRHEFVPDEYLPQAYANHPLPIGYGQTISQPYVVALMTEAVGVGPGDRVLEIGTGSGYQAAVLAELVDEVVSVEIIGPLVERSRSALERLGYGNVRVHHADGYFGWEADAPYDAIVVTAAPDHVPQPLVAQLKVGGRMIIPVGPVGGYQALWLLTKVGEEEVRVEDLGPVAFVPLTREAP
jgi:protein-L-isoaspartate(D-aspartate) O-methyltransferase